MQNLGVEERDPITALLGFLEAAAIFSMEERREGNKKRRDFFFLLFFPKGRVRLFGLANLALLELCIYRLLKHLAMECSQRFAIFSSWGIYFVELYWWPLDS